MNGQSLGEKRVRANFNTSGDLVVDTIKQRTSLLINVCEEEKVKMTVSMSDEGKEAMNEANRCFSLAQTYYETAAMYAVKGLTSDIKLGKAGS